MDTNSLTKTLNGIDIEDLQYVERDLCFYELVSIGFLLYADERSTAEFVLQKLLITSNTTSAAPSLVPRDLLRTYAANVNKSDWRDCIVEALAIINARRVLRKLGFKWETVSQHYLPHIGELCLHIHPLLKALYKICESMTTAQAGRLIFYMDEHFRRPGEHLRFYDNSCLEVFLLDWITRRVISVGDRDSNDADLQALFEYFKLNDLEEFKTLLTDTVKHNTDNLNCQKTDSESGLSENSQKNAEAPTIHSTHSVTNHTESTLTRTSNGGSSIDSKHAYKVRYESAGIVLIINQKAFYEETDPNLKHLLPKSKLTERPGTDLDKEIIAATFSAHGYKPIIKENLTHIELLSSIRENARRSVLNDSFVVCILSHGFNGVVCGSNSIPVSIEEIEGIFAMNELDGKPKLLIIQACQTDPQNDNNLKVFGKKGQDPQRFADVLRFMSTVPGFPSIRHTQEGSWFIQSLANTINELGNSEHLLDITTKVTSQVTDKRGEKRDDVMLPMAKSTLRRCFFLPARKN